MGRALELLLSLNFELLSSSPPGDVSMEEVMEQREEEMTALSAIYGSTFSERIPKQVWIITLELPFLTEFLKSQLRVVKRPEPPKDTRELCRFFLRGNCRFSALRCNYSHSVPKPKEERPAHLLEDTKDDTEYYELEIRFPEGNIYPFESPVVAFVSRSAVLLPSHSCLNITERLVQETKEMAASQSPAVFSLVSILENEDEIKRLLLLPAKGMSLPEYVVPSKREEPKNIPQPKEDISAVVNNPAKFADAGGAGFPENDDDEEDDRDNNGDKVEEYRKKYKRKEDVPRSFKPEQVLRENRRLKDQHERKQEANAYKRMQVVRRKLPAWDKQKDILQTLHGNQVVVVSGMTG